MRYPPGDDGERRREPPDQRGVYGFLLPLGATINMDGTAYQGMVAIFAASLVGVSLTIGEQLTVVAIAVLASIGAAGSLGPG